MAGKILVSTAYLPPIEYFSLISKADEVFIEREENYLKQTYRNRCYILSSNKIHLLSVPVFLGSFHKTPLKSIRIDYSKRWQQVHLRALTASYSQSPYFEFYFESIEKVILRNHEFLLDLNTELTELILKILNLKKTITYTTKFEPSESAVHDYRYKLSPKKESAYRAKEYIQVFKISQGSSGVMSIVDLLFNTGPDAAAFL
jgi:hypothetical protein